MKLDYHESRELGWGNILIHLSDFLFRANERGETPYVGQAFKHIDHEIFPIKEEPDEDMYTADIFINPVTMRNVHSLMRTFVKPPPFDVKKYSVGLHIRRGAYGSDSQHLLGQNVGEGTFYCDDKMLSFFIDIIQKCTGSVFLASDSIELKRKLIAQFPDKLETHDMADIVHVDGATTDGADSIFRDWYTLSACDAVFCTAGDENMRGFSTFGYTAAVYGGATTFFVSTSGVIQVSA